MSYVGKPSSRTAPASRQKKQSLKGFVDAAWSSAGNGGSARGQRLHLRLRSVHTDRNLENLDWGFRWGLEDWYDKRGSALRKP